MLTTRLSAMAPVDRRDAMRHALLRARCLLAQVEDIGEYGIWEWAGPQTFTGSEGLCRIFDLPPETSLDLRRFLALFPAEAAQSLGRALMAEPSAAWVIDETWQIVTAAGSPKWLRITGRAVIEAARSWTMVGLIKDVTAERDAQPKIHAVIDRDALTELPNRCRLHTSLSECVKAPDHGFALLAIDLDDFRAVNDRLGHAGGDGVLAGFAAKLRAAMSDTALVARIGGDQFGVMLPRIDSAEAAEAEALSLRERLALSMEPGSAVAAVGYSIGISLFPQHGTSADQIIEAADFALERAKAAGRQQIGVFRPEFRDEVEARQRLIADMRIALSERQLILHYQPIVDLRTGIVRGWEALVRWQHPSRGLLQPGEFLPHIDNRDLAVALDCYVLEEGLAQLRRWLDAGHPVTCIGVNISAHQLRRSGFVEDILAALARHRLTPDQLKLEILESAFFGHNVATVGATIARLSEIGVVCALDDFGTGYASLTHLKQFKVERIKIDRSFIQNILYDRHDKAITRSMIELGRNLGIRVTAEGIETIDQLRIIQGLDCDCGQGYLFGRPMPPDAVPTMLARWNAGLGAQMLSLTPPDAGSGRKECLPRPKAKRAARTG